jgi:hypothetical protein
MYPDNAENTPSTERLKLSPAIISKRPFRMPSKPEAQAPHENLALL